MPHREENQAHHTPRKIDTSRCPLQRPPDGIGFICNACVPSAMKAFRRPAAHDVRQIAMGVARSGAPTVKAKAKPAIVTGFEIVIYRDRS
jgi:hypothetical protein